MNKGLIILLAALTLGACSFLCVRLMVAERGHAMPVEHSSMLPELEWLRTELDLTDAQFAKVRELHLAYRPTCESLCSAIHASHEKLQQASEHAQGMTPELEQALREHAETRLACQKAMTKHLFETAACLDEARSARYLRMMLPHALFGDEGTDHPASHASHAH